MFAAAYLIAGVLVALGLLMLFLGARLAKPVIFLSAFLLSSYLAIEFLEDSKLVTEQMVNIGALVLGLLAGILSVLFFKVGIFMLGAMALALGTDLVTSWLKFDLDQLWILGIALLGGIIALFLERRILIIATAAIGSSLAFAGGVFIFAPELYIGAQSLEQLPAVTQQSPLWRILYLVIWVALWAAGVKVQNMRPKAESADEE